jgi:hypothetical protein
MTVAAFDRIVHHATIIECNTESYRRRTATKNRDPETACAKIQLPPNQRSKLSLHGNR